MRHDPLARFRRDSATLHTPPSSSPALLGSAARADDGADSVSDPEDFTTWSRQELIDRCLADCDLENQIRLEREDYAAKYRQFVAERDELEHDRALLQAEIDRLLEDRFELVPRLDRALTLLKRLTPKKRKAS